MRYVKFLITLFVISVSFMACNKKKEETKSEVKSEVVKQEVKKVKKPSFVTTEELKALSDIFLAGDTFIKEKKEYQKEISELSRKFKDIKNPFLLKKDSKFKYTRISYFSNSVWTSIYSSPDKKEASKLFWIIISYRHNIDDNARKAYKEKIFGLNAKRIKNSQLLVLLKGDIEIKIIKTPKANKNDKAIKEILKEFDIKAIETVFNDKTPFLELKEYLLKVKNLNVKINAINDKFKAKGKAARIAFKPFINKKGFLKDYNLSKIYYSTANSFSIYVKKDRKKIATIHIGRANLIGAVSYFKIKDIKAFKVEGFNSRYLKNKVVVKLPKLAVKITSYLKGGFATEENLKKIATSIFLKDLAKIK